MKRLVLLILLLLSSRLAAQVTAAAINTPNTFTQQNDFTGVTNFAGPMAIPSSTVGGLPAASAKAARLYMVTDGLSSVDCTAGGGSTSALCMSNGVAWVGVGAAPGAALLLQTNGVTNSDQTKENLVSGANVALSNSAGATTITAVGTPLLVWTNWDVNSSSQLNFSGYINGGGSYAAGLSHASVKPTASVGWGDKMSASATASTNTVLGVTYGQNGNNSLYPVLAWYRLTHLVAIGNLTNARYWIGLGCWANLSAIGSNGTGILGTTAYANDLPNKTTLGFRFSAGTDTHWQAVSIRAGTPLSTVVDTGVTPDTNMHVFEMTTDASGTTIFYFIDRTLVATINTNLPQVGLAADSLVNIVITGDNKNTATATSLSWFGTTWNLK